MAETIIESMNHVDAIGVEHTDLKDGSDGAGAQANAASLGVDYEELLLASSSRPLVGEATAGVEPGRQIVMELAVWTNLVAALIEAGFLYGVRWEQQRGE